MHVWQSSINKAVCFCRFKGRRLFSFGLNKSRSVFGLGICHPPIKLTNTLDTFLIAFTPFGKIVIDSKSVLSPKLHLQPNFCN